MSKYIANRALRGATGLVGEAEMMLTKAIEEKGPDTPVQFPNTAYYLPTTLGLTGREVETLADLVPVVERAKSMLHPAPTDKLWKPYLGETLDAGVATLLAAEAIEGVRFVNGTQPEIWPGFELGVARNTPTWTMAT